MALSQQEYILYSWQRLAAELCNPVGGPDARSMAFRMSFQEDLEHVRVWRELRSRREMADTTTSNLAMEPELEAAEWMGELADTATQTDKTAVQPRIEATIDTTTDGPVSYSRAAATTQRCFRALERTELRFALQSMKEKIESAIIFVATDDATTDDGTRYQAAKDMAALEQFMHWH